MDLKVIQDRMRQNTPTTVKTSVKEMKAKVDPRKAGLEVLSIRKTRKKEVLLVLKKGGDVSAFRNELVTSRAKGEGGSDFGCKGGG